MYVSKKINAVLAYEKPSASPSSQWSFLSENLEQYQERDDNISDT